MALPAPCPRTARGARATPTRGGGTESRGSASAHTRNGHATQTRRVTGPSLRNAETAWSGVLAGKGKGYPDGTTRHTHRQGCEEREEPKGIRENRQRPRLRRSAASASRQSNAPAPQLGSLRASPRGSRWRQASSTGPAAPAARGTTDQGCGLVGKRLQPRLLSDALTGEWQNGEAGEGQGSEPREPGGLLHSAGGVS